MNRSFWKGKNVFLTGHTGFKGGWLALWLIDTIQAFDPNAEDFALDKLW